MDDVKIPPFVSSSHALVMVTKATGTQASAMAALASALRHGNLEAWGVALRDRFIFEDAVPGAPIPAEFWSRANDYDVTRWSWSEGSFCISPAPGQQGEPVEYRDVAFATVDVIEVCEANDVGDDLERLPGSAGKDAPPPASSRKRVGGRAAGKAGYAHATFILAIQSMGDLANEKVDVLAALLAEEYQKIGMDVPAQDNLKTWASSMRSAILGQSPDQ